MGVACAAGAMLLVSCEDKRLSLPADPVDRAATCGVVAAAEARLATAEVGQALPLEAQGRILHHVLLAASEGGRFVPETAASVNARMQGLQEEITSGKWRELAPACRGAFPAAAKTDIALPEARLDAQLACEELAQFLATALEGQEENYGNELAAYRRLRRELNDALAPGLARRAGPRLEAQKREREKSLAAAAQLG